MHEYIKIPKKRIAVLIGSRGSVKAELEKRTGTKIVIVPDSTDIEITGDDAEGFIMARDIVVAIGRGFRPKIALQLLKEDIIFEMVSLKSETENTVKRLMARVIGRRGSVRRRIEKSTGVKLSVFGKTVSFIGGFDDVQAAKRLVNMILSGRPLPKVFGELFER